MSDAQAAQKKALRCFFITPIGSAGSAERKRADWVFRFLTEVCGDLQLEVDRADIMSGSTMITSRIFGALTDSAICVADLSGLNANVFYELGIRHAVRKPVIHIAENGTPLPFDNAQHDTHFYDLSDVHSTDQLKKTLREQMVSMLDSGYSVSNPLTAALGVIEVARSGDPKDQLLAQMSERLERLERRSSPATSKSNPNQRVAKELLNQLIETSKGAEGKDWSFNSNAIADALRALEPTDEPLVLEAYGATYVGNLLNRSDIRSIFYAAFPNTVSHIPITLAL